MKIRFLLKDGFVVIRGIRKDTQKWDVIGTCHPASVSILKKDGIFRNSHLIKPPAK